MSNMLGKIYNIQNFSVYDGPGLRTTIFLKGCNLQCVWCHNPESMSRGNDLFYYAEKCGNCGKCVSVCPSDAHKISENGHSFDRSKCTLCGACEASCYFGAMKNVGQDIASEDLMNLIRLDKEYFERGAGGVTFSGGECMLQIDFLAEMLRLCKEENIHTAVDTAGNVAWVHFERILDLTDVFLLDLKNFDPQLHKENTGSTNKLIHENLQKLIENNKEIIIRIPCIKFEDIEDILRIGDFLAGKAVSVELLEYHKLGISKQIALDIEQKDINPISTKEFEKIKLFFISKGINCI